jgi:hypothetical protein
MGASGGSLEPPGSLLTHLHTVYMAYSECLRTLLNPLAERKLFSQAPASSARPSRWPVCGGSSRGRVCH